MYHGKSINTFLNIFYAMNNVRMHIHSVLYSIQIFGRPKRWENLYIHEIYSHVYSSMLVCIYKLFIKHVYIHLRVVKYELFY